MTAINRSLISTIEAVSSTVSIKRANSSPPTRASVSCGRIQVRRRLATSMRSRSPAPMTEAVIDQLETVKIHEKDGKPIAWVGLHPRQRDREAVHEESSIAQFRQIVVKGRVEKLGLDALAFADFRFEHQVFRFCNTRPCRRLLDHLAITDIALNRDPVREPTFLIGNRDNAELDPEFRSVLATVEKFNFDRFPAFEGPAKPIQRLLVGFLRLQQTWRLAEDFFLRVARRACKGRVTIDDPWPGQLDRLGLRDKNGIIGVDNNGFKQAEALAGVVRGRAFGPARRATELLEIKHRADLRRMRAQHMKFSRAQAGVRLGVRNDEQPSPFHAARRY